MAFLLLPLSDAQDNPNLATLQATALALGQSITPLI